MGGIWQATLAATSAAEHAVVGAAELTAHVLTAAQESSLNGPITKMRRYSAARVDLAVMKQVCRDFDVTLNDVALAAITNSYRMILLDRGETPGPHALAHAGSRVDALGRRLRCDRQPGVGDVAALAGR